MIDVQCAHCGGAVPHFAHAKAKYCSEHCKREARPASRSKPGIALWHGWQTRRKATLHGHHDDALTVDHLIPVSDIRSSHTPANLKLAHRRCNRNRNNHVYNERIVA